MTDKLQAKKPELTLVRGGKIPARDFIALPIEEKLSYLRMSPAKVRMEMILADPDAARISQALQPQELYWIINEIGATDAIQLLEFASPEQRKFFLDMELWKNDTMLQPRALKWLAYLMEMGEKIFAEQLRRLDPELLTLILFREIKVGGGIGELLPDDERTEDWDHSFDNLYFISFRNPKHSRLIGTFLDIVYRRDQQLYQALMEGVKNEVESELEEQAYAFKTGRLEDLGFPSRDEAIFIYARVDPASFSPAREKKELQHGGLQAFPTTLQEDSLLSRALKLHNSEELLLELNYLVNSALVAEQTTFDREAMQGVMQRVSGYLSIALEFLCGNDVQKGADMLERESLKRLFQLGHSIVQGVRKKARRFEAAGNETAEAFKGLKGERPKFYRGLDEDRVDGYREFSSLDDVRKVEEFLAKMED